VTKLIDLSEFKISELKNMTEICEIGIIKNKFSEPANPAEMKKHESIIKIRKK